MSDEVDGWEGALQAGQRYLKTLRGSAKRPEVFTQEIRADVGAMAFEQVLAAMLLKCDPLAEAHGLPGKLKMLRKAGAIDEDLAVRCEVFTKAFGSCGLGRGGKGSLDLDGLIVLLDDLVSSMDVEAAPG